jgi:hypothetical protein
MIAHWVRRGKRRKLTMCTAKGDAGISRPSLVHIMVAIRQGRAIYPCASLGIEVA